MKKLLSLLTITAVMASCNNSKTEETTVTPTDSVVMDANNTSTMADTSGKMMVDTATKMMNKMADTSTRMMNKMSDTSNKMMNKMTDTSGKMMKKKM